MKRLFLLRHGKAVPHSDDDKSRGLTDRGIADSFRMGVWLREEKYKPDMVLCSPSTRTRETLEEAERGFERDLPASFPEALYLASAGKLLGFAQDAPDKAASLLMVGHNPGMEELAQLLTTENLSGKARGLMDALEEKFPTAALAILDFKVDRWRDIAPGEGKLKTFLRPKDL